MGSGAGASTYNIDDTPNGKVAIIDSMPSQANRIEPLFRKSPYDELVPQITIKAEQEQRNLLDVGHRAADAFVRYSELGEELEKAFRSYKDTGNALALAKLAPTTLIFGGWDFAEPRRSFLAWWLRKSGPMTFMHSAVHPPTSHPSGTRTWICWMKSMATRC